MSESYEVYYNDGDGWQPSNLGRFATYPEHNAARLAEETDLLRRKQEGP